MADVALYILAVIGGGVILQLFNTGLTPLDFEKEPRFRLHAEASETEGEFLAGNPS
jgi:hypothetical protein